MLEHGDSSWQVVLLARTFGAKSADAFVWISAWSVRIDPGGSGEAGSLHPSQQSCRCRSRCRGLSIERGLGLAEPDLMSEPAVGQLLRRRCSHRIRLEGAISHDTGEGVALTSERRTPILGRWQGQTDNNRGLDPAKDFRLVRIISMTPLRPAGRAPPMRLEWITGASCISRTCGRPTRCFGIDPSTELSGALATSPADGPDRTGTRHRSFPWNRGRCGARSGSLSRASAGRRSLRCA